MNLRKSVAGILTMSFILPSVLLSGCGKAKDKPKELISEDTPWYDAAITDVDTGLDPADYFYLYTRPIGIASDLIICESFGSEYYNLNDFNTPPGFNILHVYDTDGNHLYDKAATDIVLEYCPSATNINVNSVSLENGLIKLIAGYNVDMTYYYQNIIYDPAAQQISSVSDIDLDGNDLMSTYAYDNWTADGYSIRSYLVFTEEGDDNYLEFTSASGDMTTVRLEDTYVYDDIFTVYGFLYLGESRFIFKFDNAEIQKRYCYIDLSSGTVCDVSEVSEFSWIADVPDAWDYVYFEGVGNICMGQQGIKILNLDSRAEEMYLSYDNTNINRYDAGNLELLYATEDKVVLAGTSQRESFHYMDIHDIHELDTMIVILNRAASNPNAGKALLRAGSIGSLSYGMAEAIRLYNDSDAEAFITLDPRYDYNTISQTVVTEAGADRDTMDLRIKAATINTLSLDLLAGDGPDIILGGLNYTQFNRDDLLLDLAGEVDIPNVYDNIMAFSMTGDKLYQVPIAFGLEGILAEAGDVDAGDPGFTFDNYRDYVRGACNGKDPNGMNRLDFMSTCVAQMSSSIRTDNGFDFNNPEFASAAAFVNDLVLPTDEELFEEEKILNASTMGDEPDFINIVSAMELLRVTQSDIESRIMMGFPSSEPRGLMVNVMQSVAVSAATSCPGACKEFVRMLVGDDFQAVFAHYDGIAVNSAAEAEAFRQAAARTNASYEVMTQHWDRYLIDQMDQAVMTCDPEVLVQQMDGYIRSASGLHMIDTAVEIIVREEIQAYFAGQKTIEVVMDAIQTRVDLYLSERG